jgi:phage terminase small subunit
MSKVHQLPPRPAISSSTIAAPKHLPAAERRLWDEITAAHRFDDPASLAALTTALEACARARKCREQIDRDGETVRDRFGQLRAHPLLGAERDARHQFLAAMKILRLDLTGVEQ